MSWEFVPTFDAAHRAALEAGKPLLYVCPPAGWALVPLAEHARATAAGGAEVLVLAPSPADVMDVAGALEPIAALRPVHGVSGVARARRLLADGAVRALVLTPSDALALASQSSLPLAGVRTLMLAWPEAMRTLHQDEALEAVLAEAPGAQRLIATTDERDPALADLLARIAHRAPVVVAGRPPETPLPTPLRWVGTDDDRRAVVARAALDVLNPRAAMVWEPMAARSARWSAVAADPSVQVRQDAPEAALPLAIAGDLPTAEVLAALAGIARDVLVLARASQVPYLERLSSAARPLRIAGEADAALDRASALRRRLRDRLAEGSLDGELLTLGPLFDEHDPTLVAAAALALAAVPPAAAAGPESPGWARLLVSAGRRDGIRPGDLVGALVNEVGLPRKAVGRIDVRDTFTLVEVRADTAEQARRGLTGVTLRGKRVTARPDRR